MFSFVHIGRLPSRPNALLGTVALGILRNAGY